jgi:COP9 signalosome complex subunit 7
MPTVRELEDLIIDAIYLDILRGKLDQKEEQLEVEYTMGRDLEPGKLEEVLAALQNWQVLFLLLALLLMTRNRAETTTAVLATLDEKINDIAAETAATKLNQQEHEKALQANLKEVYDKQKDKSLGGMMGRRGMHMGNYSDKESMHMDVDEPPENSKGKNRK